jgi:hypothetical protein
MHPFTIYAEEVARDRERLLDRYWHLADVRSNQEQHPSSARRAAALVLAALTRGSATAVARLDDCVSEDLRRSLAPAE